MGDVIEESVLVVGAGRVGTALVRRLLNAGIPQTGIVSRVPHQAQHLPPDVPVLAYGDIIDADFDVIILAVPDDAIAECAGRIAAMLYPGRPRIAIHTSGATPASHLTAFREKGASILSLHPIVSFPPVEITSDPFIGAHVSLQGDDDAVTWGAAFTRAIGAHPFPITVHQKQVLHAAVTLSANYSVSLMAMAADLITDSGVSLDDTHSLLAALHQSVLRNFEAADPGEALTGPLVRGDIGTLTTHLELLDELAPEVAALYRAMGKATARFALQSGRINNVSARAIEDALSE